MAAPTSIELDILSKFQDKLADLNFDNGKDTQMFLLRFLRARNHNLTKAERMIREHLEWKKVNKIDSLLDWMPPQYLSDNYPYDVAGFDKQGCPIMIAPFGLWDVRKVCEKGMKEDYVKYVDQLFLYVTKAMQESSRRKGVPVTQFVCIMIPDEFQAFRQMSSAQAVDTVLETVKRFESQYPESLKCAFVIDAPKVFNLIFSVIKPLLNSTTLGKVTISSSEKEWKAALLKIIDEDQLCVRLGGTRKSKVPILDAPKGAYKSPVKEFEPEEAEDGFLAVTIGAGKTFKVQHDIEQGNCQLCYTFQTENHDIGFSLQSDHSPDELVSYTRVSSHLEPNVGEIHCSKPGKYTLIFDNTFSRFRSKNLRYRVVVEQPNDKANSDSSSSSVCKKGSPSAGNNASSSKNTNGNGSSSGNDSEIEVEQPTTSL